MRLQQAVCKRYIHTVVGVTTTSYEENGDGLGHTPPRTSLVLEDLGVT